MLEAKKGEVISKNRNINKNFGDWGSVGKKDCNK